jgi:FkbM family methyltransferase
MENMDASKERLSEAVYWAYRLILGREPESDKAVEYHVNSLPLPEIDEVRQRFLSSPEFTKTDPRGSSLDWGEFRYPNPQPREPGFYRDAIGIRTRLSFLPPAYDQFSGAIPGDFGLEILPIHERIELDAMLTAGHQMNEKFTVVEMGAGWGPWISMGARMAERKGLPYRLVAVEASADHLAFLRAHIDDNEIDPACCRIVHGAIGAVDGAVRFPKLTGRTDDYGVGVGHASEEFEEVAAYSITTLLKDEPIVNVLHCDIQGAEADAFETSVEAVNSNVRCAIIGTHGRSIEERLHTIFTKAGWSMERDKPCGVTLGRSVNLAYDGVQVWTNPRLS